MKQLTVAVCIDDRMGMLFAGRRQSRDRVLISELLQNSNGKPLCISPFSKALFAPNADVAVYEDLFAQCPEGSICFLEEPPLLPYVKDIHTLILYRWNRHYPADRYFDLSPTEQGFSLVSTVEFEGSSHERITKEVYVK